MKTCKTALLALALLLGSTRLYAAPQMLSSVNDTPSGGIYVGMGGGVFWMPDFTIGAPDFNVTFKHATGEGLNVPVGFDFGNGFKVSVSGGYAKTDYAGIYGNYGTGSQRAATYGNVFFVPIMANVAYSFRITDKLHWEFGVGVGAVYTKDSFSPFDNASRHTITFGQLTPRGVPGPTARIEGIGVGTESWEFGFQAYTGLTYDLTDDMSISAGYRYLFVKHEISVNDFNATGMSGHQLEASLIYKY